MKRVTLPIPEDGAQNNTQAPPSPTETGPAEQQRLRQKKQPQTTGAPEIMNSIILPALKVGVATGTCGVFSGATFGILRSSPIGLFALVSGGQWFTLGSTYMAARLTGLRYYAGEEPTPSQKVQVSTVAGATAATVAGALRGRANILPGIVMFSLYGAGGQTAVNWWTERATRLANAPEVEKPEAWWEKYMPLKRITEEDYIKALEERLLRAEADIALVDEHIQQVRELKRKQKEEEAAAALTNNPAAPGEV